MLAGFNRPCGAGAGKREPNVKLWNVMIAGLAAGSIAACQCGPTPSPVECDGGSCSCSLDASTPTCSCSSAGTCAQFCTGPCDLNCSSSATCAQTCVDG